jgi:hypothetical protein
MAGNSVQENIDKLTKAWIAEGKALPVLYPLETVELVHFAERHGVSSDELVQVFRVLVEQAKRTRADLEAFGKTRFS